MRRTIVLSFFLLLLLIAIPQAVAQTDSAKTRPQQKREGRFQQVRDEKKRLLAQRIEEKLAMLNKRRTDAMAQTLAKLERVLAQIEKKATSAKADGKDTKALEAAIQTAQGAIATAKNAVSSQAAKTYLAKPGTDATLSSNVGSVVSQLRRDLRDVHKLVVDTKQAVQNTVRELARLGGRKEGPK